METFEIYYICNKNCTVGFSWILYLGSQLNSYPVLYNKQTAKMNVLHACLNIWRIRAINGVAYIL